MSNFFKDKVMDDLENSDDGWLTLAIEPYTFSLLDNLREKDIPEKYTLSYDEVIEACNKNYDMPAMLKIFFRDKDFSKEELDFLNFDNYNSKQTSNLFIEDGTWLDRTNEELHGEISILINLPDENEIQDLAAIMISRILHNCGHIDVASGKEVQDILGCPKEEMRSRSSHKIIRSINRRLQEIIRKDEWKIRNIDLMLKAAKWTVDAASGKIDALANLTKLKCMTYSDKVIYSMEEVK